MRTLCRFAWAKSRPGHRRGSAVRGAADSILRNTMAQPINQRSAAACGRGGPNKMLHEAFGRAVLEYKRENPSD